MQRERLLSAVVQEWRARDEARLHRVARMQRTPDQRWRSPLREPLRYSVDGFTPATRAARRRSPWVCSSIRAAYSRRNRSSATLYVWGWNESLDGCNWASRMRPGRCSSPIEASWVVTYAA